MPFRVCYYHLVWATKGRLACITPDIERIIISTIKRKSAAMRSPVYAINGTEDHIHVAVSIYTSLSVAEWAKNVKGVSSHEVNLNYPELEPRFHWQSGYSVHTFGAKVHPVVIGYIENQKLHHKNGTLENYLEECEPEAP
jgi:putative transposase